MFANPPTKKFKNVLFTIAIITIINVLLSPNAKADVMNPDFLTKQCIQGEKEIICSFSSEKPFGPRTVDECKKYEKNNNYYYLVGHGSSFGGREKYCLKIGAKDNAQEGYIDEGKSPFTPNNYFVAGVAVITISAISLLTLFLIRRKNASQ